MSLADSKHVFVSYVREDNTEVDKLCAVLEASKIPYWRDRNSLGPGDAWKAKIREAIQSGSLVFLACFSDNSRGKDKSHMNEELTLAVDEYRKMPPGRTWLIPVRFDSGDVPEWDLGAGRTLRDLNYSDLFGDAHAAQAASLVTTIHGVMGEKQLSPAAALEAVEQATAADRVNLLKKLTKEILLDSARRIELDDLVSAEVQRVVAVLNDSDRVSSRYQGTNEEFTVHLAEQAQELWTLAAPFCASLQVAARWGTPDLLAPWANGLRSFLTPTTRIEGGIEAYLNLRHLPGMVGIVTASIACVASRNWANLRTLVVEPTVRERNFHTALSILEATAPYKPFGHGNMVALTLARGALEGKVFTEALEDYTKRRASKLYTPEAEWLHYVLRPIFVDQIADQDTYDVEFDRAEVMLSALAQDQAYLRGTANPDNWRGSHPLAYWFGRSTWRAAHYRGNPVEEYERELATQGALWGPLKADLFGGDEERAKTALEGMGKDFTQSARQRH